MEGKHPPDNPVLARHKLCVPSFYTFVHIRPNRPRSATRCLLPLFFSPSPPHAPDPLAPTAAATQALSLCVARPARARFRSWPLFHFSHASRPARIGRAGHHRRDPLPRFRPSPIDVLSLFLSFLNLSLEPRCLLF
jgi:hypothetical protein